MSVQEKIIGKSNLILKTLTELINIISRLSCDL